MVTPKAGTWSIRISALLLALFGVVGRDSAAKAPAMLQSMPIIPVPNMVAYWAVDGDTGGIASDLSGNGNNGTYAGGITTSATVPNGTTTIPSNNTTSFNLVQASNQYISVPDSPSLSLTGSFTLAAYVRTTLDSTLQQGIIEKYDAPSNGYSLRIGGNEHYGFSVWNGTTQKNITTAGTSLPFRGADINQWNHVAAVYQQGVSPNMRIFKNGSPDATTSANTSQEPVLPPTDGTTQLQIGKDYGSNAFQGQIDEVRIYNRALTQTEIQILRDGQPPPTMQSPSAIAGFNQINWTAPAGAPAGITYSLLHGPSTNNYTGVINNITATTYDHAAPQGVPTYYRVVAVTVMASPPSTLEVSSTPGAAGPPPPPPPPRTTGGNEDQPCGCGTATPLSGALAALGLLSLVLALIPGRFLRG